MFKQILVPLDGSGLAERALPLASKIAEGCGCRLLLLRVVPYFTVLAADPLLYEEMNRMGEDEAAAHLRQVRDNLAGSLDVEIICEVGSAADSILQYAKDNSVELIVMSSHGRSGINRWVYGSVAERVLSQAPCPTLIINAAQPTWSPDSNKILVPLDGSELAEKALVPASELAKNLGLEMHLLRVTTTGSDLLEANAPPETISGAEGAEIEMAQSYLDDTAESLALDNVFSAVEVANGSIAGSIVDYAARNGFAMIVMSSHGRTGLRRWVYGSVAEKVLRSGCCATMIVRNV